MIALILGLAVFAGISGDASADSHGFEVKAHVYLTPPAVVSTISGGDDGKGGIIGRQVGGIVTSQFPDATVILKLDAAAGFTDQVVQTAIGDNFRFQCGDDLSVKLTAKPIGSHVFPLMETPTEGGLSAVFRMDDSSRNMEYRAVLRLTPLPSRGSSRIVELRCEIAHADIGQDNRPIDRVLNQIVEFEPQISLLIGFPVEHPDRGRFIYWIALMAESKAF